MNKYKKLKRMTAGRIVLLSSLSLLFILLLWVWLFFNYYTPQVADAFDDWPGIGNWGNFETEPFERDDIYGGEHSEGVDVGDKTRVDRRIGDSYTFLIAGMDDNRLTDALMMITFNVRDSKISILNIPRDSWISNSLYRGGRINAVYSRGFNQVRNAGGSSADASAAGIALLRQQIQITFGLPVDYYVVMTLRGFRELVDAVGGVEMYVPRDMYYSDPYQNLHINLKRGLQTLDGIRAEHLVRFRRGYADQDIGRIATQQRFIAALARQMMVFDVAQISRIFDVAQRHVTTNISAADMAWFAARALNVRLEDIITHIVPGESARVGEASVWSVYRAETIQIINAHYNPFLTEIPDSNFNIFEISRRNAAHANISGVTMDQLLGN